MCGVPFFSGFKGTLGPFHRIMGAADILVRLRRDICKRCVRELHHFHSGIFRTSRLPFALDRNFIRSTDFGSSFACTTNAAGGFCARNNADRVYYPAPHKRHWSCPGGERPYACADLNASFGGPGDMYPSMLQLRDGRVLLTFTKRCNPAFPPMWSSTAGVPPPDPASGYNCECSNGRL